MSRLARHLIKWAMFMRSGPGWAPECELTGPSGWALGCGLGSEQRAEADRQPVKARFRVRVDACQLRLSKVELKGLVHDSPPLSGRPRPLGLHCSYILVLRS